MAINSVSASTGVDRWTTDGPTAVEESGAEEFSGAVAAADLVAAQAGQKPVDAVKPGVPYQQQEQKVAPSGGVQSQATGKIDKNIPRTAGGNPENASLIQKMAVSSNTGVDIAGLKPWSPDWVFEGGMNKHPAQKTLIEDPARGGSAGALEGLEQLLQQAGATMAGSPDGRMAAEAPANAEATKHAAANTRGTKGSGAKLVNGSQLTEAKANGSQLTEAKANGSQLTEAKANGTAPMSRNGVGGLGSDDFVNVRQAAAGSRQAKGAVGTQQAIAVPGAGLKSPHGAEPEVDTKDRKARITDTLGLIHPQGGRPETAANVLPFPAGTGALKMEGAVVAGSMSRNRLDSEAVGGISQSIRELGNGGEVRIRLKPDHLGELHLKVITGGRTGSDVGLQIHASDDRAKRILEESLGSLRESLASQNLSLAKVDVQVSQQPSSSANLGGDSMQDRPGLSGQQNFSSNSGDGNRGNSARDGSSGSEAATGRAAVKTAPRQAAAFGGGGGSRAVASSRLDVIA